MSAENIETIELIKKILPHMSRVVVRNKEASVELRGSDLAVKQSDEWITIYHASAQNSEQRSHIHLRRHRYKFACIDRKEMGTPFLAFWSSLTPTEDRGPFVIYFRRFYKVRSNEIENRENYERFHKWVNENGREFLLKG